MVRGSKSSPSPRRWPLSLPKCGHRSCRRGSLREAASRPNRWPNSGSYLIHDPKDKATFI
jgi:hypothetical protein